MLLGNLRFGFCRNVLSGLSCYGPVRCDDDAMCEEANRVASFLKSYLCLHAAILLPFCNVLEGQDVAPLVLPSLIM